MKDKEEDLALFLEMRKREKERNSLLLLHTSEDFDPPLGSKPGGSPIFKIVSSTPHKTASDDFLNSDSEKNDYDWLLTPPGTPLFPSLEMESNKSTLGQIVTPKARPTALKSRVSPQYDLWILSYQSLQLHYLNATKFCDSISNGIAMNLSSWCIFLFSLFSCSCLVKLI
ncbi:uncharacterized protein LOC131253218 isoform X1 [Magnolia sinica]|uniref:uncharacterized protein LOC131253218 isoform X1 n=1 Tax=Magnolia sinica TaxID=86752 RepID=UPI002659585C|nr:uncharacterized protein LOC131253218 isoform X1 [Magnolia sinica]